MNKRIQAIAEQAGFFPELNWDYTGWHAAGHDDTFEKFAQLIIDEYDQVITNQMREYRFDERVHLGLGDVRFTIGMQEDILKKAKQHFGLE